MDVLNKCLALIFSAMILGQAYLVRRYVGTWLFPACLFGIFWFGYTFIPLIALFWIPATPYATGFILLCTCVFSIGSLPFDWKKAFRLNRRKRQFTTQMYGNSFVATTFYFSTAASLIFLILDLSDQGISILDFIFDLQASAASYANLLYSESLKDNIYGRLNVVLAYVGPVFGGFLFSCTSSKRKRVQIVILALLPAVFAAVTQTTKGLLFFCIVLFYAGLLVCRLSSGRLRLLEKGSARSLVISLAVLVPTITASFLLRGLSDIEDNDLLIEKLLSYYASYSCGHLYAFSDWFSYIVASRSSLIYDDIDGTHGFYTFATIFKLMGSERVLPLGIFEDYYTYENVLTTNIYTMFRGLILDFGFAGSLLFMLATGFLFHLAFHAFLRHRKPVFTAAIFVFMVGYFYNSYIISILGWSRVYVAFVLLCLLLQTNKLLLRTTTPRWRTGLLQRHGSGSAS